MEIENGLASLLELKLILDSWRSKELHIRFKQEMENKQLYPNENEKQFFGKLGTLHFVWGSVNTWVLFR